MVTVDHNKNIQRIIDVIKSDSSVYDEGKTKGKLRSVEFGDPGDNIKQSHPPPYAYVTTDSSIQETTYDYGTVYNNLDSITMRYKVVVMGAGNDKTTTAQKQLYTLLTNLRNILTSDPTFADPESRQDPAFARSVINASDWDSKTRGKLITAVEFTIKATIGVGLIIEIPTDPPISLNVISDSGEDGRNNKESVNDQGYTKRSKGEFVGVRFFEYEYDTPTFLQMENAIEESKPTTITLNYPSGSIDYPCKLEYQRQSRAFTGIRSVFLQVNRETA